MRGFPQPPKRAAKPPRLPCPLPLQTILSVRSRRAAAKAAEAQADDLMERRASGATGSLSLKRPLPGEGAAGDAKASAAAAEGTFKDKTLVEAEEEAGGHEMMAGETEGERALRRHVFQAGAIPW